MRLGLVLSLSFFCFGAAWGQNAAKAQTPEKPTAQEADDSIETDRPSFTDSPNVIGKHFQIETGLTYELHHAAGDSSYDFYFPTTLRFGIDSKWEFRVDGNAIEYLNDHGSTTGYTPWSIGFKYHWQDSSGKPSKPSLGLVGRILPPSGSSAFATTIPTAELRLCATFDLCPKWQLQPNFGVASYQDNGGDRFSAMFGAVELSYQATAKLAPFIDASFQSPESKHGLQNYAFDGGFTYLLNKNTQLDFSVGRERLG